MPCQSHKLTFPHSQQPANPLSIHPSHAHLTNPTRSKKEKVEEQGNREETFVSIAPPFWESTIAYSWPPGRCRWPAGQPDGWIKRKRQKRRAVIYIEKWDKREKPRKRKETEMSAPRPRPGPNSTRPDLEPAHTPKAEKRSTQERERRKKTHISTRITKHTSPLPLNPAPAQRDCTICTPSASTRPSCPPSPSPRPRSSPAPSAPYSADRSCRPSSDR